MVAKERIGISLGLAMLTASAWGCSTSPSAPAQAVAQPPAAASRTVQSLPAGFPQLTNPPTLTQMSQFLPEKISTADANRLLVHLDPNKIVKTGGNYHTQAWWGYGWRGWRGLGAYSSLYGGYWPYSYYPSSYSSLLYYPYGSYYYPYYYNAGSYYPYSLYGYSSFYYPYLYGYNSYYYPYSWYI